MLEYLCRKGEAEWIKSDDEVSIYEIGDLWICVNEETDTFNQQVKAIGLNEKNKVGEYKPFVKREGWHFSTLTTLKLTLNVKRRYENEPQEKEIEVAFQYMYAVSEVRCIVCIEGDEVFSTDYECWEDIERFLSTDCECWEDVERFLS